MTEREFLAELPKLRRMKAHLVRKMVRFSYRGRSHCPITALAILEGVKGIRDSGSVIIAAAALHISTRLRTKIIGSADANYWRDNKLRAAMLKELELEENADA